MRGAFCPRHADKMGNQALFWLSGLKGQSKEESREEEVAQNNILFLKLATNSSLIKHLGASSSLRSLDK